MLCFLSALLPCVIHAPWNNPVYPVPFPPGTAFPSGSALPLAFSSPTSGGSTCLVLPSLPPAPRPVCPFLLCCTRSQIASVLRRRRSFRAPARLGTSSPSLLIARLNSLFLNQNEESEQTECGSRSDPPASPTEPDVKEIPRTLPDIKLSFILTCYGFTIFKWIQTFKKTVIKISPQSIEGRESPAAFQNPPWTVTQPRLIQLVLSC